MTSEEGGTGKVIPVRVAVRLRPLSVREIREGCQESIDITHDSPQVSNVTTSFMFLTLFFSLVSSVSMLDLFGFS